jgi:hypothetical protein
VRLLDPANLHLAWLALIPLALWLFRRQARRVPVSTLLFFKSLAREHQESAWLRRVKKWLSLLLTLLVLLLAVLTLARPVGGARGDSPGAVVLVIDRSASMAAQDDTGRTRVDEARRLLAARVRSLPDQAVLSLIAFDSRPQVLLSRSRNRRECLRLLDEVRPLPVAGDPPAALAAARRLADLENGSRVWVATDTRPPGGEGVEFLDCALPEVTNAGITGFQIRPSPLSGGQQEVFVKISAAAANRARITSTLEVTLAGRLAQIREIELDPGASSTLILPVEAVRGQQLDLRLRTPGDVFPWDDALTTPLPKSTPLHVAWITEQPDPFTGIALASLVESRRIEMTRHEPAAWPLKEKPDVYVFEHWMPADWPADRPVIALNPRRGSGPVQVRPLPGNGIPHDGVRGVLPDHPVLFRAASSRIALTQSVLLSLPPSIEPLWIAGTEPVLAAGEHAGQRIVVTAYEPARSEQLALLPAFPLLLGNALYWCAENSQPLSGWRTWRTGELLPGDSLVQWRAWDGARFLETADSPANGLLPLHRIGAWEAADGRTGASVLADERETNLAARDPSAADASARPAAPIITASAFSTWPQRLLWAILALLVLESFLFHRKAVY